MAPPESLGGAAVAGYRLKRGRTPRRLLARRGGEDMTNRAEQDAVRICPEPSG